MVLLQQSTESLRSKRALHCQRQALLAIRVYAWLQVSKNCWGYQTSVSNEVIEHLFKKFSLSRSVKYVVTQNSGDTRDARCSDCEEQHTHHDFNESEDTLLRCYITNNQRTSFSCHNIRNGNTYYCIFALEMFPMLKMLTNPLSHHFALNRAVMALVAPKKKAKITSAK